MAASIGPRKQYPKDVLSLSVRLPEASKVSADSRISESISRYESQKTVLYVPVRMLGQTRGYVKRVEKEGFHVGDRYSIFNCWHPLDQFDSLVIIYRYLIATGMTLMHST